MREDKTACLLCGDDSDGDDKNKGTPNCKTCTKTGSAKPECTACLDGYFYDSSQKACTQQCATNCATCSEATNPNKCLSCKAGYFLVEAEGGKKCVACDSVPDGGREGCSACSNDPTFKCADCKPNYKQSGPADSVTCTKVCEDGSACGAIVMDGDGKMKHHCSRCRQQQLPVDDTCTSNANGSTCAGGYFTRAAAHFSARCIPSMTLSHWCAPSLSRPVLA